MAGSAGSAALAMVGVVQRFSLSAGVAANLSDAYRGAACGLQWSNFYFPLLGGGSRPACYYFTYNTLYGDGGGAPSPPPAVFFSGRRSLFSAALHGWDGLEDAMSFNRRLLSSSDLDNTVMQAYERLLLVAVVLLGTAVLHWVTLRLWASCACSAKSSLPSLLVFPHLELLMLVVTTVAVAQSGGTLLAANTPQASGIGAAVVVYLAALVALLGALAFLIGRVRERIMEESKVSRYFSSFFFRPF